MTRTIYVVFPTPIDGKPYYSFHSKHYAFLCNYDCLELGDIIVDPRYTSPMLVIKITDKTDRVQDGITLKDIYITKINGNIIYQPSGLSNGSIIETESNINKQETNNMEKRNIKVTLEQAIEWYNSGNETLRTLALTVYTEEELTFNIEYMQNKTPSCNYSLIIPVTESRKAFALADLAVIAKYFNKDWKKTPNNTGYFLGQSSQGFTYGATMIKGLESLRNIGIVEHNTVMYPGIVYFKEKEDLIKAVKILGDKAKDLFRY